MRHIRAYASSTLQVLVGFLTFPALFMAGVSAFAAFCWACNWFTRTTFGWGGDYSVPELIYRLFSIYVLMIGFLLIVIRLASTPRRRKSRIKPDDDCRMIGGLIGLVPVYMVVSALTGHSGDFFPEGADAWVAFLFSMEQIAKSIGMDLLEFAGVNLTPIAHEKGMNIETYLTFIGRVISGPLVIAIIVFTAGARLKAEREATAQDTVSKLEAIDYRTKSAPPSVIDTGVFKR